MQHSTTPMQIVGEFDILDAFSIARTLEHAGITTELDVVGGMCRVSVPAQSYELSNELF